jgi:hypothetical protein
MRIGAAPEGVARAGAPAGPGASRTVPGAAVTVAAWAAGAASNPTPTASAVPARRSERRWLRCSSSA